MNFRNLLKTSPLHDVSRQYLSFQVTTLQCQILCFFFSCVGFKLSFVNIQNKFYLRSAPKNKLLRSTNFCGKKICIYYNEFLLWSECLCPPCSKFMLKSNPHCDSRRRQGLQGGYQVMRVDSFMLGITALMEQTPESCTAPTL